MRNFIIILNYYNINLFYVYRILIYREFIRFNIIIIRLLMR